MRSTATLFWVLAIGLLAGFGSVYLAIAREWQPSTVAIGPWTIQPRTGLRDADPYARAEIAREGLLPLGAGEGALFIARQDSDGRPLDGACLYTLSGTTPPARAWTLALADRRGRALDNASHRPALTSSEALRTPDGRFSLALSDEPASGNWLGTPRVGRYALMLRLYDTPVAGTAQVLKPQDLPAIRRLACR